MGNWNGLVRVAKKNVRQCLFASLAEVRALKRKEMSRAEGKQIADDPEPTLRTPEASGIRRGRTYGEKESPAKKPAKTARRTPSFTLEQGPVFGMGFAIGSIGPAPATAAMYGLSSPVVSEPSIPVSPQADMQAAAVGPGMKISSTSPAPSSNIAVFSQGSQSSSMTLSPVRCTTSSTHMNDSSIMPMSQDAQETFRDTTMDPNIDIDQNDVMMSQESYGDVVMPTQSQSDSSAPMPPHVAAEQVPSPFMFSALMQSKVAQAAANMNNRAALGLNVMDISGLDSADDLLAALPATASYGQQ